MAFKFNWINTFIFNVQRKVSGRYSIKTIEGVNEAIGLPFETLWSGPVGPYPFKFVAGALTILSSSIEDGIAETGAQVVELDLLDGAGVQTTVQVDMDGTTPVAIPGTYMAVNRVEVIQPGSVGTNIGNISVLYDAGDTLGFMAADRGRAQQAAYTIPIDKEGYVFRVSFTSASGDNGFLEGRIRPPGGAWSSVRPQFLNETVAQLILPFNRIPPGSMLELRGKLVAGGGSVALAGDIDLLLRRV